MQLLGIVLLVLLGITALISLVVLASAAHDFARNRRLRRM